MSLPQTQAKPETAPANIEAERALLGQLLYDNAAYERVTGLKPEHFFETLHGRLFHEVERRITAGQLAEPIVLHSRFEKDEGYVEAGGLQMLAQLVDDAPPAAWASEYARTIRDLATRRVLIQLGGDIAKTAAADNETPPPKMIESVENALYGLAEKGAAAKGDKTFAQALAGAVEAATAAFDRDGGLSGISTGLIDLDRMLGGLHPSDLLILAARPSIGKTGLATDIAFEVARKYAWEEGPDGQRKTISGGIVQFFSLEMSAEQLAMRVLAQRAGVSGDRIRRGAITPQEYGLIRDAAIEIQEAPLFIDDSGAPSIAQIATKARRRKRQTGLDLIVVDYLQLATANEYRGQGNRVAEVSEITAGLKAIAKELEVPVLALSQLSRKVEEREDKRPQLADLRESGSIEQDADVVMFLYREAYYKGRAEPRENTPEHMAWLDDMDRIRHDAELIIGKQRHGPIGTVKLHFNEDLISFTNAARDGRYSERESYTEASKPRPVFSRDPSGADT